jgi:hypothetical protein
VFAPGVRCHLALCLSECNGPFGGDGQAETDGGAVPRNPPGSSQLKPDGGHTVSYSKLVVSSSKDLYFGGSFESLCVHSGPISNLDTR